MTEIISRGDARAAGLPRYFTGKPCPRGHICEKYIGSGHCIECDKERTHKYHADPKNRIKIRENKSKWRKKNRPSLLVSHKLWTQKNPEKVYKHAKEWHERNPGDRRKRKHIRRARERGAIGVHTPNDIAVIRRMQNGKCAYCRVGLGKEFEIDHILPLVKGGSNEPRNIQLLCTIEKGACNRKKSGKDPIDFAQSLGFLL